jgi:hypothetical protein
MEEDEMAVCILKHVDGKRGRGISEEEDMLQPAAPSKGGPIHPGHTTANNHGGERRTILEGTSPD